MDTIHNNDVSVFKQVSVEKGSRLYSSLRKVIILYGVGWVKVIIIQLFRERLSEKVHTTISKGFVGGFKFTVLYRNLKELVRKAMEMCLRVLKKSNKSRFNRYSRQKQCIDHIPYYLSGLSHAHFSDNLSRNSCIKMPRLPLEHIHLEIYLLCKISVSTFFLQHHLPPLHTLWFAYFF